MPQELYHHLPATIHKQSKIQDQHMEIEAASSAAKKEVKNTGLTGHRLQRAQHGGNQLRTRTDATKSATAKLDRTPRRKSGG
jgi:hypothetical protein